MLSTIANGLDGVLDSVDKQVPPSEIHILLVDDERLSRVVISNLLRKCKYRVTCAESGAEAIDLLTRSDPRSFHLILTDVVMPYGIDGIELLKHVRGSEAWAQIPVVMMSANETADTVLECISLGAEDYLLKPVTRKEVQNIWQHVWRRSNSASVARGPPPQESSQNGSHASEQRPAADAPAAHVEARGGLAGAPGRQDEPTLRGGDPGRQLTRLASGPAPAPDAANAGGTLRSGALVDLNDLLEACHLPLQVRLELFCRVLLAINADSHAPSTSGVRPSAVPSCILASQAGDVTFVPPTAASASHFSHAFYAAPRLGSRADQPGPGAHVYALGVLLLELVMMPSPAARRRETLLRLAQRILPPSVLTSKPAVAVLVMRMLAPDAQDRPSLEELSRHPLLAATYSRVAQGVSATGGADAFMQTEVLLDFFLMVQRHQGTVASTVASSLQSLDADIAQVQSALARLAHARAVHAHPRGAALRDAAVSTSDGAAAAPDGPVGNDGAATACMRDGGDAACSGACKRRSSASQACEQCEEEPRAKRQRGAGDAGEGRSAPDAAEGRASPSHSDDGSPPEPGAEAIACGKWGRLMPLFPHLLTLYQRERAGAAAPKKGAAPGSLAEAAVAAAERRRAESGTLRADGDGKDALPVSAHLRRVAADMAAATRFSALTERSVLSHGNPHTANSMLCSIAVDHVEEYVATASVNKSVKIYRFADLVDAAREATDLRYPVLEILSRSKLSCICYNTYIHHRLATSDYEGVIELWDTQVNTELASFEEHTRRVWAIDCSALDPHRLVSGSDDGTVKLWNINDETSVATIQARMNVCTVAFSPVNANLLAFGTADCRTCVYDMRKLAHPIASVTAARAVSYVRFMDGQLLSATIDSTIRLFDVDMLCAQSVAPLRVFTGHTNARNFVGLSCNRDGYIMTGSETNELMLYHRSLPAVLAVHRFGPRSSAASAARPGGDGGSSNIVSCVCASQKSPYVFAGSSDGLLKVLHMT